MSQGESGASRPNIVGLSYMAFQSSAIDKAMDYYRAVLGYERQLVVRDPTGAVVSANIMVSGRQWIELRPESEPGTDRLIEFGFLVERAEDMRLYLAKSGVKVPAAALPSPLGNLGFSVSDPDGHTVSFTEIRAEGWPAKEAVKGPGPLALSDCLMHFGFDVRSLDRAMAFYENTLGFMEMWRGSSNDRTLAWVQLRLPEDKNYIEFMLSDEAPSLEQLGVFNHFGLEVASMSATMEEASLRLGAKAYPRTVAYDIGKCRHRLANVYDPDGTRAEFMERRTFDGSVTPSSPLPAPEPRP